MMSISSQRLFCFITFYFLCFSCVHAQGPNLALNKMATISSTDGFGGDGNAVTDGDLSTRWASAWSDYEWIYIDLEEETQIERIVLHWETAFAKTYSIEVSNDEANWTTIYMFNGDGGRDDIQVSATGRFVKILGHRRGTYWGFSLWEVEIFGPDSEDDLELAVSSHATKLPDASSITSVSISANTSWTACADQPWIKLSNGFGLGDSSLNISVRKNHDFESRSGVVTISNGVTEEKIVVTQDAKGTEPDPDIEKISCFAPAFESSNDGYAGGPEAAVDCDPHTRWASEWTDDEWIYMDLGDIYEITGVKLIWERAYGKDYVIQTSYNARDWETIFEMENSHGWTDNLVLHGSGRYIRMLGVERGTWWGYSLWEFEVYGKLYPPFLDLPLEPIVISGDGGDVVLELISNVDWTISTFSDWLEIEPAEGSGYAEITMSVDINPSSRPRSTFVIVEGAGMVNSIFITQAGLVEEEKQGE